ncbi:hypothetical protein T440DRAFT_384364 [Plenodomus tracheiphilus IPT5]|uniref:Arrestin-like N-terminal domain-containing protein n=1 Tax=Plenodomus tracheiphilus IPT5 TaxID=1408161 RepID=A0A6A7BLJ5_9PLEO|nr:hypothetical protein T440DRAFT_384364 [Plenodomus tracheiphilus IPT5]
MAAPALRVIVDGENDKVYRKGDKITGRVILLVEEERPIESLKLVFAGSSITRTTRPLLVNGNTNNDTGRHDYEEKTRLFNREKEFVSNLVLEPKKHSWPFEFTFPELTEQRFKRLTHGANYLREPHALPPSFHLKTNVPGGTAQISYFLQARLVMSGSKDTKGCKHLLRYHPRPHVDVPREAKVISAVLYGQQWKPRKEVDEPKAPVSKGLSLRSSGKSPRIVPCFSHPESIAPGQHIPLSISLRNARDPTNEARGGCTLDSLSVTISTFSTVMCGHVLTQPEDIVSKHVTCITRTAMNKSLPFNGTKALTTNFRLIDDNECVPTFKTYNITRRYTLSVSIGIKYGSQHFTVRSSTPLEILPRIPRELPLEDGDEIEPLPLYTPREPSKEFAPDYESIYALSPTTSILSSTSNSLSPVGSRSSSLYSGGSSPSTVVSTPAE